MPRKLKPEYQAIYVDLGGIIRKARNAAGLTQAQLGDAVGLDATTITRYESGATPIAVHVLVALLPILGLRVDQVL